mmetsp:Transcript_13821/g.20507  ORF Transcript_13821/g.20507 Transcript_13821/m.20507 type:complete len:136 (-) Transcript_13821:1566-1973(-)
MHECSEISIIRLREESNHVDIEEDEASIPDQFIFFDSKNDTFKRRIIYKTVVSCCSLCDAEKGKCWSSIGDECIRCTASPTCAICLKDFEQGDDICKSQNYRCNHFFHRHCGTEWFVRRPTCPCCRLFYLVIVPN